MSLNVNFHSAVMRQVSAGASILHTSDLKQSGLMGNKADLSVIYLPLHLSLNSAKRVLTFMHMLKTILIFLSS